jgi:hypothetical protein
MSNEVEDLRRQLLEKDEEHKREIEQKDEEH